ncbi:hypothetical protein EPO04_02480 [Patescibacteria group bacterium]|nr:MAG: hypothetical protein EPO04_02480 [Patescibacteria group bacterium]
MLEPITPQEYFEGLEDCIPGNQVKIERSYLIRLVATADISILGCHAKVYELLLRPAPAQGVFKVYNIRLNAVHDDVVGHIWAEADEYFWIAFQLLESGELRDRGQIVGYVLEPPDDEEEDTDPSLDRTRPLVAT